MNKVRLFLRPNRDGAFSIEKLFNTLAPYLKKNIALDLYTIQQPNKGLFRRIRILAEVIQNKSHLINHITGDINFIALVLKRHNTILTIHDIDSYFRKNFYTNSLIRFFWLYLPLRWVKHITVISQASKNRLLDEFEFLKKKEIHVIPNCLTSEMNFLPKKFNEREPVILQIGTKANKNLPNLIKAVSPINCRLIIVGRIDDAVRELLNSEKIIYEEFIDITDNEIAKLYMRSDIVTLISKYEGFGLPILEANAIGRVVITSNVSSMPEVAGESALLVDPNDIIAIRNAIRLITANRTLREELINKGIENVKRYAPSTIAREYIQLYKYIIALNETKYTGLY